jgi:ComF family protein
MLKPLLHILKQISFPTICVGCQRILKTRQKYICNFCFNHLPFTNYEVITNNQLSHVFYGRAPIQGAFAGFFFTQKGSIQYMLHALKYSNNKGIGYFLGQQMGQRLLKTQWLKNIQYIVPVPLHQKKLQKRGYNQSYIICQGIAAATGIPLNHTSVLRHVNTQTQTQKTRAQRWQNVANSFTTANNQLAGKTILLIDDVITTGATTDACAQQLLAQNCQVYIGALAYVPL